ncbi:MAG: TetR/AcrR family transcriptional regulator [Polyangiales bacterium]
MTETRLPGMPRTGAARRRDGRSERRAYRKQPTQARARATVEIILQAARRLLVRKGYAKLTTNAVAKTAGVSIGSLYQYFPNKRALVGAVLEEHVERKTSELRRERRRLVQSPVEDVMRHYARWMVESHRDEPALHRILVQELPRHGLSPKLAADYEQAIASNRAYLEAHASELVPQNHELSAFIIIHTMESLTKAALARDPEMLNDELIEEITSLLVRYLKPG